MQNRKFQEHFVAPIEETPVVAVDKLDESQKARSTWDDAWDSMRRRPSFWISSALIVLIVTVAAFPGLFTSVSPNLGCELANSNGAPTAGHPLGFTRQGCDVYARIIFGTQASVTVGLIATLLVTISGIIVGSLAGYYGGFLDAFVSRVGDIFFAIPTVLGAIVLMSVIPERTPLTVAFVLAVFAWPQIARIMRGAVLSASNSDYVTASTALGVSKFKILLRHVVPNSIAPVIVVATISLGTFIVAEATLSFLGIGLPPTVMSWGNDIAQAQTSIRTNPQVLLLPSAALSITVLSFLMLGDVVRDALDPAARARR
ncbi:MULTISPECIES: ABC transporter permease [Microterricola]|uniref:Oligopeptide transport system permease protein n=2 Tax=Microterricola TaxID=518733 RepID=A0A1H1XBR4_9MICO|nr:MULTISPECIES: ABC transporter permease [Microterricola]PPL16064.1 peptide ABC transporter permease [Microterricola pindariensis]SDT06725.1 oligopeptide transport system permease protein [Microterricola viridarii]